MYCAICVPGFPEATDRITVNAAIESLPPAVKASTRSGRDVTARCERHLTGASARA
jgi:hypothetical protein